MRGTVSKVGLCALCGILFICTLTGCVSFRGGDEKVPDVAPASYHIKATPGPGASRAFYSVYLFPSLRMSKNGSPVENMKPWLTPAGEIGGWKVGNKRSAAMSQWMEDSFRQDNRDLITFPQLLECTNPYTVMVVSAFYTNPLAITDAKAGDANQTLTVKVKGVLFGLDLDPAKSLPIGTVVCTGFFTKDQDDVEALTGKLIAEAARNLGDQLEGFGYL